MRFYMLLAVALLLNSVMSTDDVSIHQTDPTRLEKRDKSRCPEDYPKFCQSLKVDTCCRDGCKGRNQCKSKKYLIWE
uniref:Superfamily Cerm-01 n=1 Tax=Conus magus TaxID=6492 RepID=A0A679P612_CONMA|nr:TPA_inf: superfamily Cerm-01 [Conus magus]